MNFAGIYREPQYMTTPGDCSRWTHTLRTKPHWQ